MTSNIGAEHLLKGIDQKTGAMAPGVKDKVMVEVKKHFRPEFLNRLDDIVVFAPLSVRVGAVGMLVMFRFLILLLFAQSSELGNIVRLQLVKLSDRLKDRDVSVKLTDAAAQFILSQVRLFSTTRCQFFRVSAPSRCLLHR